MVDTGLDFFLTALRICNKEPYRRSTLVDIELDFSWRIYVFAINDEQFGIALKLFNLPKLIIAL